MRRLAAVVLLLVAVAVVIAVSRRASGQAPESAFLVGGNNGNPEPRLAGLQWRFVRVKYHANSIAGRRFRMQYWGDPWATDGPAADQNLTRRVRSATSIEVGDPIVLTLEDPTLFQHPWIYFVEPGNLELTDPELPILREFLLRGGTATFDDFHGPYEWESLAAAAQAPLSGSADCRGGAHAPDLLLFLQAGRLSPDPGTRLVPERPDVGEGRVRAASPRYL